MESRGCFEECRLLTSYDTVNIRFTSSLTDHDENVIAPALLNAVTSILDALPIAYVIRIDTSDSSVYQHSRPLTDGPTLGDERRTSAPANR
jgi:hypothetical protein